MNRSIMLNDSQTSSRVSQSIQDAYKCSIIIQSKSVQKLCKKTSHFFAPDFGHRVIGFMTHGGFLKWWIPKSSQLSILSHCLIPNGIIGGNPMTQDASRCSSMFMIHDIPKIFTHILQYIILYYIIFYFIISYYIILYYILLIGYLKYPLVYRYSLLGTAQYNDICKASR